MARGVILVNGIGQYQKGEFLVRVVDPLVSYLESKGAKVDLHPEIALAASPDQPGAPQVTLKVYGPGGFSEEWLVQEAYWQLTFQPPALGEMFTWGRQLTATELQEISRIAQDPLNLEPERGHAPPQTLQPTAHPVQGEYPKRTQELYLNHAFVIKTVLRVAAMGGYGLLTLVWLLLMLRRLPNPPAFLQQFSWVTAIVSGLTNAVNSLANAIYPFVVHGLGDVKVFIDSPIAADAIRRPFEDVVIGMLQDERVESITVISHSFGTVVSYDAMTKGRPIDLYLREHKDRRNIPGSDRPRPFIWVTVGAALNRGYTITRLDVAAHAKERFRSPVAATLRTPPDAFYWLNLYSRYDPVPAGPINLEFRQITQVKEERSKERSVINRDSLLLDHNAYWTNSSMVWPRIVRAICGGEYPWPRIEMTEKENQELIRSHTVETAERRRRALQLFSVWITLGILFVIVLGLAVSVLLIAGYLLWQLYRLISVPAFWLSYGLVTGLRRLTERRRKNR
jgi:nitrate reductase NapE component